MPAPPSRSPRRASRRARSGKLDAAPVQPMLWARQAYCQVYFGTYGMPAPPSRSPRRASRPKRCLGTPVCETTTALPHPFPTPSCSDCSLRRSHAGVPEAVASTRRWAPTRALPARACAPPLALPLCKFQVSCVHVQSVSRQTNRQTSKSRTQKHASKKHTTTTRGQFFRIPRGVVGTFGNTKHESAAAAFAQSLARTPTLIILYTATFPLCLAGTHLWIFACLCAAHWFGSYPPGDAIVPGLALPGVGGARMT